MNKEQLKKSIGTRVLLRPAAIGSSMAGHDDEWTIAEAAEVLALVNMRTDTRAVMGLDAAISYMSDPGRETGDDIKCGILQLAVQLQVRDGGGTRIEPLPFARGGANSDGVNLLRLELRKAVAETYIELDGVLDLIRKCHQSRIAVMAARGLSRSGAMETWKRQTAEDSKEMGGLKRELPNQAQDFSSMPASELKTQLVNVHRIQKLGAQCRERYARQLELDDEQRREIRARVDEQVRRIRREE
jgi:hypothetical protein